MLRCYLHNQNCVSLCTFPLFLFLFQERMNLVIAGVWKEKRLHYEVVLVLVVRKSTTKINNKLNLFLLLLLLLLIQVLDKCRSVIDKGESWVF